MTAITWKQPNFESINYDTVELLLLLLLFSHSIMSNSLQLYEPQHTRLLACSNLKVHGGGAGGENWKYGINKYKSLFIKWQHTPILFFFNSNILAQKIPWTEAPYGLYSPWSCKRWT